MLIMETKRGQDENTGTVGGEGRGCGGYPSMEGGVWPFLQERVKKEWDRVAVTEVVGSAYRSCLLV